MVLIYIIIQEGVRGDSMNIPDLIKELRNKADLTKSEAKKVVDLFFDEMSNALANGDRVEIRGFCSFYVKHYKAYTGRNPRTGEQARVKAKKLPFFKCGNELKERVDYQR
jgi:integration host factor subunit beta